MAVNIREQIALKRAEAKKAAMKNAGTSDGIAISWVGETPNDKNSEDGEREEDELGRISVKDTIDRARTSGQFASGMSLFTDSDEAPMHREP
jgi:hypothetical protein